MQNSNTLVDASATTHVRNMLTSTRSMYPTCRGRTMGICFDFPGYKSRIARGLIAVFVAASLVGCSHGDSRGGSADAARADAERFLATYVAADGRVVRHDQGDDTVAEGQSYALVLAQVASDDATFGRVWDWTAGHLL